MDSAFVKVLNEIKNINDDVSQVFVFKNCKILSKDNCVKEEEANKTIEAFEALNNTANVIDGIESITIQGTNGRVDINHNNDFFSTIVTSREANQEKINDLTHVIAPAIFEKFQNMLSLPAQFSETNKPQPAKEIVVENCQIPILISSKPLETSPLAIEYAEFTVDNMGRLEALSISPDTIKLDIVTVGRWMELFGENKINTVMIKVEGTEKTLECKYETSRDQKHQLCTVLLSEPIQRKLQTKKGSKILVKPIIQQDLEKDPLKNNSLNEIVIAEQPEVKIGSHSILETNYSEFTVEDAGRIGIITLSSYAVKLNIIAVRNWAEIYGTEKFHAVMLKDPVSRKTIECKYEVTKDPKHERKSVSMSEPLQRELQTKKGSKILIKPIIWEESAKEKTPQKQPEVKFEKLKSSKANTIIVQPKNLIAIEQNFPSDAFDCQLMVQNVSSFGSLSGSDTVHFDESLVMRWKKFYGNRKINEVTVSDPFVGKSVTCKFKIVKDSKSKGNGHIQIPTSIQKELSIKEGSLVIIKPVLK